jgi:hypothetical protein
MIQSGLLIQKQLDIEKGLLQTIEQEKCCRKAKLLWTRQVIILMNSGQWEVRCFGHHQGILSNNSGMKFETSLLDRQILENSKITKSH